MATRNLTDAGILSIPSSAPVQMPNRNKDVSPSHKQPPASPLPQRPSEVCLKKTELRGPGGGDMHPVGKDLCLAPRTPPGRQGHAERKRFGLESHRLGLILASSRIVRVLSFHFSKPQFPHLRNGGVNGNTCLLGKDVALGIKALAPCLALCVGSREAEVAAVLVLTV